MKTHPTGSVSLGNPDSSTILTYRVPPIFSWACIFLCRFSLTSFKSIRVFLFFLLIGKANSERELSKTFRSSL